MNNMPERAGGLDAAQGCLTGLIIMLPVWLVLGMVAAWLLR